MPTARGNATLYALAHGAGRYGVPAGSLISHNAILPAAAGLVGTESPTGAINASGYVLPGIPGPKGGPANFAIPLRVAALLEYLQHFTGATVANGGLVKTTLEAGPPAVYRYDFDPVAPTDFLETQFWGVFGIEPVERWLIYGLKWAQAALPIGDNVEIPVRLTGTVGHGTLIGPAEDQGASAYTLGPWLRGPLANPAAGKVCIKVNPLGEQAASAVVGAGGTGYTVGDQLTLVGGTLYGVAAVFQVATAPGGVVGTVTLVTAGDYSATPANDAATTGGTGTGCELTVTYEDAVTRHWQAEQTTGSPTYPGQYNDILYNADAEGAWMNVQGGTNLDLGVWNENRDPLELIFPGDAAAHADLDAGGEWHFEASGWTAPASATVTTGHRMTSAHWFVRARTIGAPAYTEYNVDSGALNLLNPLDVQRGNSTRYVSGINRLGPYRPTIELVRSFIDRIFAAYQDLHQRLDLQLAFEGQQLGTGAYRESLLVTMPSAGILSDDRPVANVGAVKENIQLVGETDANGASPCTLSVITTRNWTPLAAA